MKTFFDSSAFAKRYIEESGSQSVITYCEDATELALSVLCVPEIVSALNRHIRAKTMDSIQYTQIKNHLLKDIRNVAIVDLTDSVISTCIRILETSHVRAADAIPVACAVEWKAELFLSADKRQVVAAENAGLRAEFV